MKNFCNREMAVVGMDGPAEALLRLIEREQKVMIFHIRACIL